MQEAIWSRGGEFPGQIPNTVEWSGPVVGIDLTPIEIADEGCWIYLFLDGNNNRLIYTTDFGCSVCEKFVAKGTVLKVIYSLFSVRDEWLGVWK
ncbi:Imm42 family immunity protein [Cupriavidus basilensis]|uniref:Imm42 family immunity protein n=1 Tax=Cupriavidus basilensis TaxID=68895 RepID=UPI001300C647